MRSVFQACYRRVAIRLRLVTEGVEDGGGQYYYQAGLFAFLSGGRDVVGVWIRDVSREDILIRFFFLSRSVSDVKLDTLSAAAQETLVRSPAPKAISIQVPLTQRHTAHFLMQRVGLEASFILALLVVSHPSVDNRRHSSAVFLFLLNSSRA